MSAATGQETRHAWEGEGEFGERFALPTLLNVPPLRIRSERGSGGSLSTTSRLLPKVCVLPRNTNCVASRWAERVGRCTRHSPGADTTPAQRAQLKTNTLRNDHAWGRRAG